MRQAGFAREVITPPVGTPLAGYFNPRISKGVHDDLFVRAFVVEDGPVTAALVIADLVFVSAEMVAIMRHRLKSAGIIWEAQAIMAATHTHTAPYVPPYFSANEPKDETYLANGAISMSEPRW